MLSNFFSEVLKFLTELYRRNPVLFGLAAFHLVLFVGLLVIAPFDSRQILGINPWIKPMKFALSIAIFSATMGWLLADLPLGLVSQRFVTWGITVAMLAEISLIVLQSARGVPSHFNQNTPLDATIFRIMGIMITFSSLLTLYLLVQYFRLPTHLPPAYLWGVRLGLLLFIFASVEGGFMAGRLAHGVGVADGGAGLPFVNWSTAGGDLRIAHFIGLHAIQVLPLLGYLFDQLNQHGSLAQPMVWLWVTALLYGGLSVGLFLWAMAGHPLLRLA
jgi:hypothetical protein